MKIKIIDKPYSEVIALPQFRYDKPVKQNPFFRWLLKTLSAGELKAVNFKYNKIGMERLHSGEPCLVLMNHSAFIDLKIASTILYPKPFHIVTTLDGFVGKNMLMRMIGCIPAKKFISDAAMVADIHYSLHKLKSSVLMYPEASYSFDGTQTPLPESVGKALKVFRVPVVMIRTYGAFLHDPLYNGLKLRKVDVSADVKYLLSPEEIKNKSVQELNEILRENFTFDNFAWQKKHHIRVDESFRADGLERVLYKCPHCLAEGKMVSKGTSIRCTACSTEYELGEYGELKRKNSPAHGKEDDFQSVPDWYAWERRCVLEELQRGTYHLETAVRIMVLVNTDAIYHVGDGMLIHDNNGFVLKGCDGELDYSQASTTSYSVYADYFWYEIGDMICVGTPRMQFYCFPTDTSVNVAKVRLAAEELYKMLSPKSAKCAAS